MDTIKLKFRYNIPSSIYFQDKIHIKELKSPFSSKGNRFIYTNQKWRKDRKKRGIYTPKFWIEEDYINPEINYFVTEFSIAKLLFGENLTRLKSNDLEDAVVAIKNFFKEIKVNIFETQILNSIPILVAIGKNINVTDLCSCDLAIKSLSMFDDRFRSKQRVILFKDNTGKEINFSNRSSTFKVYNKTKEMIYNAETKREKQIADLLKNKKYKTEGVWISEVLRFELTLKSKRAITQKMKLYLGEKQPTFEQLFDDKLWFNIVRDEFVNIYSHPLKNFIFLANQSKPVIDAFLNKNIKSIKVKDTIYGILISLQEKGLKETKQKYLKEYKSRQTWYNYITRLKGLEKYVNLSALKNITSIDISNYILREFNIETSEQLKLDI